MGTNQPQEDKAPSTWNNKDSCPFCKKGTRKTRNKITNPKITHPINSIVDDPIPPIPTLPMIPTRPNIGPRMPIHPNRNPGFSQSKPTLPIAPFQNNPAPLMAPFRSKPKPTPRIAPFQPQGTQPFARNMKF